MHLLAALRSRLSPRREGVDLDDARRRVGHGARYLDERDPGWYERIDPFTLALDDGGCCVLGQLYGEFRQGLSVASLINLSSAPQANLSPVAFGFQCRTDVPALQQDEDYAYLNQAWREEIYLRRPVNRRTRPVTASERPAPHPIVA